MADHHTQNDHTLARLPAHAPSPVVRGNGPQPFFFYRDYGASGEKVTKCSTERYVATKGDGCRVQASWSVRPAPPGSRPGKARERGVSVKAAERGAGELLPPARHP